MISAFTSVSTHSVSQLYDIYVSETYLKIVKIFYIGSLYPVM